MLAARRAEPTDDLVSVFVHADVDGDRLDDHEIIMESLLLLVGGDETTRHVISGGMDQLLAEPGQRAGSSPIPRCSRPRSRRCCATCRR